MNKKALIFLIIFVLSFFVSLFLNAPKIKVPYFNSLYQEVQVDVFFNKQPPRVFLENREMRNYIKIDEGHYLFVPYRYDLVKNITIKNIENVEKITIFNGNKGIFLDEVKEKIELNNDKKLFDKIGISILSFFYNPQFYIVSYIFLFLFLYNFQFNSKRNKIALFSLLLISFLLRMTQINNIPFWDDEIYILSHTNKWLETFQDPGNPPLYFILFKIYRSILKNPEFYRFSSVVIGLIFNICFYTYLKSIFNKKTALIGLGFISFSIVLIYLSQELRCYMLLMLMAVLGAYFLFKFNKKTKYFYLITIVSILYTHFYAAFLVFYNFIFGLTIFKNKEKIKSFIIINLIAFFAYLPILIYKKIGLISDFNTWMDFPTLNGMNLVVDTLFGNVYAMVAFLILFGIFYHRANKKNKLFLKYNLFSILFVLICSLLFTYLIKPIFYYKYFYVIFPFVLAIIAYISKQFLNKKIGFVLIFILFFLFSFRLNKQNLYCNHNLYIDFIRHDIDKTKLNYIFMADTVEGYKKFDIDGAKILYLPINQGIDSLDIRKYNIKTPDILYLLNLYLDDNLLRLAKKIDLYKTPLGVFCKVVL